MDWNEELEPLIERLNAWYDAAIANLPNAAVAFLVVIVFGVASKFVARGAERGIGKVAHSSAITGLLTAIVRIAVVAVGAVLALSVLGLKEAIFSLLAGAGVVGLALGFAFQDLAANLIAGVYLGFRRPFVIGDLIETNDIFGIVRRIDLRNTVVETFTGHHVIIPNKEVFENPVENLTATDKRRLDVPVGVAYETDLEQAVEVAEKALRQIDGVRSEPAPQLVGTGFGASSIDFEARVWFDTESDTDYIALRTGVILALEHAFDEAAIEIPFPIRTLDLARAKDVLVDDWTEALGEQLTGRGSHVEDGRSSDAG
ncbi:Small-conductance mechanosensitive channel [Planctomycetes bacterium Pla163]|uniref:Small-conductance mechanosensitive channel n=1 Tax=Rohdeia mirabilis TaxID=2528008 RepID=A0A518CVD4_9BACT|nr:Small-conductance mechanosensitive channel [Planctomycetes bacterium Pla163]